MTVALKPGTRLRSVTCTTEIIVVRGTGNVDLRCGGVSVATVAAWKDSGTAPVAPLDEGTTMGKRYVDDADALEVLCTKPGAGTLSVGEVPLVMKGAKPLPASD